MGQKMSASEELKIVVLGKTGNGKSSVGNTLLNNDCFASKCSPLAVTVDVKRANGIVCGRNVTIIDTPGIFDPNRSEKDLRYEIMSCLKECALGPHVFRLVFKVERFTPESIDTVKKFQDWFGKDALKHTVVLFTHGDNIDDQMTIERFLDLDKSDEKSRTGVFKSFVESCGNRVHVIDNKYWKSGEGNKNNSFHISQLMTTIDMVIEGKEGKHYTNETLEILAQAIEAEVENIKNESEEAGEEKMSASEELKIVVLGKTGSGKSSVGNTLLNNDCFASKCSPLAVTVDVKRANGIVCGRNVTIIDTPGILNPNRSEKDLRYEIVSCLTECAPGPHVFLLVFKVERLTPESIDTVKKFQDWFGKDALKHTVVLFTHGDNIDDQMTIERFLDLDKSDEKSRTGVFKSFVESCGNRVHVIDNKYWKSGEGNKNNSFHISQLMTTIDMVIEGKEGKHYTNETLEILAPAIEAEVKNIKNESEEAGEEKMSASEELKIVLLGKTGSGKSSVGNTLLNNDSFDPKCSPVAGTGEVKRANGIVCGRNVTIIDTPGILNPNRSEKDLHSEMVSCLTECAPGPHVFLLVFKMERLTPESMNTVKKIQDWFGKDALNHTVVLFTHGDNLDNQMTIERFLDLDKSDEKSRTGVFKSFVESCGNRVHVIDNKYWKSGEGYKNNSFHISQLMTTIEVMVRENGGKHYTNKTLEILARSIEAEVENIKKELEEAGKTQDMSVIKQRARDRVKKEALRKLAGVGTGALLGTLLGLAAGAVPLILLAGLCAAGVTKIATEVKSSKPDTTVRDTDHLPVVTAGVASIDGGETAGGAAAGGAAAGGAAAGESAEEGIFAGGIGAGAAAGIGIGLATGILAVVGAVGCGMKGAEAVKRSDDAKEAADNAVQSVGDVAKKIFQGAWEAPQKLFKSKESEYQQLVEKECEGEET